MRDLCNRVPTWTPLSGWVRKLFVHLLRQQQSGDLCLSHFSCFHPEVSVLSSCLHIATWTASGESYWYIWEITGSRRGPPQGFRVRSLRNTYGRWDFIWVVQLACKFIHWADIHAPVEWYLCTDGPGIKDPCEKEAVDAIGYLTRQQCEDITQSAQVRWACRSTHTHVHLYN